MTTTTNSSLFSFPPHLAFAHRSPCPNTKSLKYNCLRIKRKHQSHGFAQAIRIVMNNESKGEDYSLHHRQLHGRMEQRPAVMLLDRRSSTLHYSCTPSVGENRTGRGRGRGIGGKKPQEKLATAISMETCARWNEAANDTQTNVLSLTRRDYDKHSLLSLLIDLSDPYRRPRSTG